MKCFDVITLFPEMFSALTDFGVTARAQQRQLYELVCWNPRDFTVDPRKTVDDRPFGGGAGMVMMAEPLTRSLSAAVSRQKSKGVKESISIFLSPQGVPLTQKIVSTLSEREGLILLAGRYEGVDQRVIDQSIDLEISVGDYVLSGGELPAMSLLDAIVRLLPGALNQSGSLAEESFADDLLEYPQYTRPEIFNGSPVPEVLLSGHHERIKAWRKQQAFDRTFSRRPDLLSWEGKNRSNTGGENKK